MARLLSFHHWMFTSVPEVSTSVPKAVDEKRKDGEK
jgi:hypothetical protein